MEQRRAPTQVSSLSELAQLTALTSLSLRSTGMSSLRAWGGARHPSAVSAFRHLRRMPTAGSLPAMPALEHLDLRNNRLNEVSELSRLSSFPALRTLHLADRDGSNGNAGALPKVARRRPPRQHALCLPSLHAVCTKPGYRAAVAQAAPYLEVLDGRHARLTKVRPTLPCRHRLHPSRALSREVTLCTPCTGCGH